MGSVFANDKYGGEVNDNDPRFKLLEEKVDRVLDGITLSQSDRCSILWWVLCEQSGEAIDLDQKQVDWFYDDSIPSICGRNIKFKDLKRGDYVYIVDYDSGDIEKAIVKDQPITSGGTSEVSVICEDDPLGHTITVDSTRSRSGCFFTNYKAAERSLETLFNKLAAHYYFYFKPEPEEIVRKLLA